MKLVIGLMLLSALVGCGNPHLTRKDLSKVSPAVAPELGSLKITNTDGREGLNVSTPKSAVDDTLEVSRPDDTVIISHRFERGEHFRFKGGTFPGEGGNCEQQNSTQKNCILAVEFFADQVGVYNDNLIVTYARVSDPTTTREIKIPLVGERLANELQPLQVITSTSSNGLDVKTPEDSINAPLSVRNPNDEPTVLEYRFRDGANFRFKGGDFPGANGNCSAQLNTNAACELDIEFFATNPGIYTDELIVTSYVVSNPSLRRELKIPLRGEKVARPDASLNVSNLSGGSSLDFGQAQIGSNIRQDRIRVVNTGNVEQTVSIRLEGGQPFSLTENCPDVLAIKESCEILVSYSSTQVGIHRDVVVVTHTRVGGETSVQRISVIGETTARPLRAGELRVIGSEDIGATYALNFGKVRLGGKKSRLIELRNDGELPVELRSQIFLGTQFGFAGGSFPGKRGTCGQIILPGAEKGCFLDITYNPEKVESEAGQLTLTPVTGAPVLVKLTGEGEANVAQVCYAEEQIDVQAQATADRKSVMFPYNLTAKGTTADLTILYGMATNSYVKSLKRYTVLDAQVFVQFVMPKIDGEIVSMGLAVDISKVIQDGHKDTESLCLSTGSIRKCSGREFTLASWQKLRNPNFWTKDTMVSSLYEDEFSAVETNCGSYTCFSMQKEYDAKRLFALTAPELEQLKSGTLNFVFSDDTRLRSMPVLKLKVKKPVSCR